MAPGRSMAAAALATRLAALADDVALRHAGRLVKLLGDGVMLHFPRPVDALNAAIELHRSMHPAGLPATHIGIDAGALIRRDSDFYGRTVNIAARLAGVAGPNEILVSDALVHAVRATGGEIARARRAAGPGAQGHTGTDRCASRGDGRARLTQGTRSPMLSR